jgi:hypothetical protein
LGIALVPQAIALARRDSIAHVPLKDVEISWELVAAYTGDTSAENVLDAAPAEFLKLLVDQGAGDRGENAPQQASKLIS